MDIRQALAFEYARMLAVARATDGLFIFLAAYVMCRHIMYFVSDKPTEIELTKALGVAVVSFQISAIISLATVTRYVTSDKLFATFKAALGTSMLTAMGVLTAACTPSIIALSCLCVAVAVISTSGLVQFDIGIGLISATMSCIAASVLTQQFVFPEGVIVGALSSHIVAHRIVEYFGGHLAVDLAYKSHRNVTLHERRFLVFPRGRGMLIDIVTGLFCGLAAGPLIGFFHNVCNVALHFIPRPHSAAVVYAMAGLSGCICCGIMEFLATDDENDEEEHDNESLSANHVTLRESG